MKIPFCLPLINNDVEHEVLSCLNETGWLATGPKVKELEDEITELCQTSSTICVNSWTSGMLLLIRWLDLD
jgi:dTDP-4-amino-4,6-dideoxygalactose transaminase